MNRLGIFIKFLILFDLLFETKERKKKLKLSYCEMIIIIIVY